MLQGFIFFACGQLGKIGIFISLLKEEALITLGGDVCLMFLEASGVRSLGFKDAGKADECTSFSSLSEYEKFPVSLRFSVSSLT